jgi:hypothetical protein
MVGEIFTSTRIFNIFRLFYLMISNVVTYHYSLDSKIKSGRINRVA